MENSLEKLPLSLVMNNEGRKTWIFCNQILHILEQYIAKIAIGNSKCIAEWREIRRTFPMLLENRSMCSLWLFVRNRYSNIFFHIWIWRLSNLQFLLAEGLPIFFSQIVKVFTLIRRVLSRLYYFEDGDENENITILNVTNTKINFFK